MFDDTLNSNDFQSDLANNGSNSIEDSNLYLNSSDPISSNSTPNSLALSSPFDSILGETGSAMINHNQKKIDFDGEYENPVVFATSVSHNGGYPAMVRFTDITGTNFKAFLEEPNYLDPGTHTNEQFSYIVLEAGTYELENGALIEVGKIDSNATVKQEWENIEFESEFTDTPIVLSQVQSHKGSDFVRTRMKNITEDGFALSMEEEEKLMASAHAEEAIGYLAMSEGNGEWGELTYEAGTTGDSITHNKRWIKFDGDFATKPNFMAGVASYDGADPVGVRQIFINANGVSLKLEEDKSKDSEIKHIHETVNFLALSGDGFLKGADTDDLVTPEITLTNFNTEEILETGESTNITWTDNIDENVAIDLYQGNSFVENIVSSTESDGSYTWTVSEDIFSGSNYNLKILSLADDNIFDFSDANFSIYKPEITITSLDNGETFEPGEEVYLTWDDNLFENIKIDLYRDNSFVETIIESTTGDGEALWIVPNDLTYSDRYKIQISSVNNENIKDITPEFFSIFQPEINILPNLQSLAVEPGEDYSIIWNDNIDENVSIDLYREDNLVSTIAESTPSDGNYVWTVPANIAPDDTYQVRVYSTEDSTVSDFSDGYFTINKPNVTVVSLNGGNKLELGQSFDITWTNNIEENVAIDLYQNGSLKQNIVQNTFNDGSYVWNVPTDLEEGLDYQIKISSAIDSSVYDFSDLSFTIEADTPVNSLTRFSNLGTLSIDRTFNNSALSGATNNLYRFNVNTPSLFELDFNGLSSNYKLELIQDINNNGIVDDKEILAHTQQSGNYNNLSIPLLPGTYFLRDIPRYPVTTSDFTLTDNDGYRLTFGATSLGIPGRVDPTPVNSYFGEKVTRSFYYDVEDDGISSYQSKYGHFIMYGDIVDYYANNYYNHPNTKDGLFRNYSGLGLPTSPIYTDTNGNQVMEFEGGTLTNINGGVTAKYNYKNGDRFDLVGKGAPDGMELQWKNDYAWFNPNSIGQPTSEVRRIEDGWIQEFAGSSDGRSIFIVKDGQQVEGGFDYYTDKNGNPASFPKGAPYRVQGAVLNFYLHTGGYEREDGLGFPISGEGGKHATNSNYIYHQLFENGFIAETKNRQLLIKDNQGGFFNVVGYDQNAIHGTYTNTFNRNGGETKLGSPINNVHPWGGGYTQDFSGGSAGRGAIMKSDANDNSYWVGGKFWDTLLANGGGEGYLSYPTSDVFNDGNGNLAQDFGDYRITVQSNGSAFIGGYVNGHKLEGDFFSAWRTYDLGTPVSRHSYNGTQFWYFDKPGLGRVSAVSTQYGTFPLWGGIREYYISDTVGGLGGDLGKPKSAEYNWNGKTRQNFEGGYILFDGRSVGYRYDGSLLYPVNNAPIVYANNITVRENNLIRKEIDPNYGVESLISLNGRLSWSDADGDAIQKVAFHDYSAWGDIIGNGYVENINGRDVIIVDANRLNEVYYTAFSSGFGKTGQIGIQVSDGKDWSSIKTINVLVASNDSTGGSGSGGSGSGGSGSGGSGSGGSGSGGSGSGGSGSGGSGSGGSGNIFEGTKQLQFNLGKTSLWGTGKSGLGIDLQGQFHIGDELDLGFVDFDWYIKGSAGAYISSGQAEVKLPGLFDFEYNESTDIFNVSSSIGSGSSLLSTYLGAGAGIDFELGFGVKIDKDVRFIGGTGISHKVGYELDVADVLIGLLPARVGEFIDIDTGINIVDRY